MTIIPLYTYKATVTRVVDGDTLDMVVDLGFNILINERVRLYDIDTPEIYGRNATQKGLDAQAFVIRWLQDCDMNVYIDSRKYDARGKYGRVLADVYREWDDKSLNAALKDAGLEK